MRWLLAVLLCLSVGCRHPVYTLQRQGRTQMLTPPPSKPEINRARSHPRQNSGCDIESDSFTLTWHRDTAKVAVKTEPYYAPPESTLQPNPSNVSVSESGPRMFIDPLAQLEKFRESVTATQDKGCLHGDEGLRLEQAITETFPFPPQIVAYLRFGTYTLTGFIDLTPGLLLRMVRAAGPNPEVSIYSVVGTPNERMRITLVSGPSLNVANAPGFYRYFYRTGASSHDFLPTILGAPDRDTLRDATAQFMGDPKKFCAHPAPGVSCQPMNVGMNAGFHVRINGTDVFLRLGGTVGEALSEERNGMRLTARAQPLPHVRSFRRIFHHKLIPVRFEGNDALSVVMMPGDEVLTSFQ